MYTGKSSYLELIANKNSRILKKREIIEYYLQKHKTPFLILQETEIRKALSYFRRYLPQIFLHYAMKSNADTWILDHLKDENLYFDVASAGEVDLLYRMQIYGNRMILANPVKDENSIRFMFKRKVDAFTFDSAIELEKIKQFKRKNNISRSPKAILRIKTNSQDVQTDLSLKFGCTVEEALKLIKMAYELGLNPAGLAFHVGTQSYQVENYRKSLNDCFAIINEVKKELGIDLYIIDIGGGFPVDTEKATGIDNLDGFFSDLKGVIDSFDFSGIQLYAEPGRIISAASGTLATSIIGKKHRDGVNWLFLNDGVYGCYSGIMYDHAKFSFIPVDKKFYEPEYVKKLISYTLAGPTCDSIDILAENIYLPEDIGVGDNLFTTDIGAYSIMSATHFNGFVPAKVLYLNKRDVLENVHVNIDFELDQVIKDIVGSTNMFLL